MTDIVVDALAVFRLWRLAARDSITEDVRSRWEQWQWDRASDDVEPGHVPPVPKAIVLVGCPWCLGFWICVAVAVVRRVAPGAWSVVREPLALSALVGLVAEAEGRLHGD